MAVYYNEFDPYAAQWLRNLIGRDLLPDGEVDERSIVDVRADDLKGFTQCHFFAGIGGWSYALRLAGWADDRPIWTGSCPCQPFSVAGKRKGQEDERHLWPVFFDLIKTCRPPVVMGEQVAAAVGKDWLDGVCSDLEGVGYACGAVVVPACAVNSPHRRDRLWFVADCESTRCETRDGNRLGVEQISELGFAARCSDESLVADTDKPGSLSPSHPGVHCCEEGTGPRDVESERHGSNVGNADGARSEARLSAANGRHEGDAEIADDRSRGRLGAWGEYIWLSGADGKARRVEPSIRLLAHGVPSRVGRLRAYGNAIVPQVAAEIIVAYMEKDQ